MNNQPIEISPEARRAAESITNYRGMFSTAINAEFIQLAINSSGAKDAETISKLESRIAELRSALEMSKDALETISRLPVARTYPDGPCLDSDDMREVREAFAAANKELNK